MNLDKKNYLKEYSKTSDLVPKTVNLTEANASKVIELNIFLSKLVRDYIDGMNKKELKRLYPSRERLKNEGERVTSSVTIRIDQKEKLKSVNFTALVNNLIEGL